MQEEDRKQEFIQALGRVIKKLRADTKRSARAISYEINISKTTLLLAESGKLDPQISTFCKLAEAFYISPDRLLKMVYEELPENWTIIE